MLTPLRRAVALAAFASLLTVAVACGDSDQEAGQATASCNGQLAAADPAAMPPSNVPAPSGAVFYRVLSQGQTKYYFAHLPGTDVQKQRNTVESALKSAGYQIKDTDQEENTEAELEFAGPHDGTLQVIHQCQGNLRLRYKIES